MDCATQRRDDLAGARGGWDFLDGETLEDRFGPGSFGDHELLDRASILADDRESFVASHPATLLDPERSRKAREIAAAMAESDQLVGRGAPTGEIPPITA